VGYWRGKILRYIVVSVASPDVHAGGTLRKQQKIKVKKYLALEYFCGIILVIYTGSSGLAKPNGAAESGLRRSAAAGKSRKAETLLCNANRESEDSV